MLCCPSVVPVASIVDLLCKSLWIRASAKFIYFFSFFWRKSDLYNYAFLIAHSKYYVLEYNSAQSFITIIAVLLRLSSPAAFLRQPVQMSPEKGSLIQSYHKQLMDLRHITETSALTLSIRMLSFYSTSALLFGRCAGCLLSHHNLKVIST